MNENELMCYYIMNRKKVWNDVCNMKDENERFEMIEKLIIIEKRLEATKLPQDRVGGQF